MKRICFVSLILVSLYAKGQKDSLKAIVKDSILKSSISLNSGVTFPLHNYPGDNTKPGPEFDLELRLNIKTSNFGVALKVFYVSNKYTALSEWGQKTYNSMMLGEMAGVSFALPVNRFSIGINGLLGLYQNGYNESGRVSFYNREFQNNIFDIGLNSRYSLSRKWLVNLDGNFISTISSYDFPSQYISFTAGIGYKF